MQQKICKKLNGRKTVTKKIRFPVRNKVKRVPIKKVKIKNVITAKMC